MNWKTPADLNLSQSQIDEIAEKLWHEANATASKRCPDCGVHIGQQHLEDCDVARCTKCGMQAISCDEHLDSPKDIWEGLWPGTEECYRRKLIAFYGSWSFDYDELAIIKAKSNVV